MKTRYVRRAIAATAIALCATTTVVACGSDDSTGDGGVGALTGDDARAEGSDGVDDTDSGIDVGPVTDPLAPGEEIRVTFNENNRQYNEDQNVEMSVKLDNVKNNGSKTCFDLISTTEKAEGGRLDEKYDTDAWDEGPYEVGFATDLTFFSGEATRLEGTPSMIQKNDPMRINIINGGRISERVNYDAPVYDVTKIENPEAPFGEQYFVQVCVENTDNKQLNVSLGNIFGYPEVADIKGSASVPDGDTNFDRLDHQDSTGWVIDPQ